jgi:hypothetical protein
MKNRTLVIAAVAIVLAQVLSIVLFGTTPSRHSCVIPPDTTCANLPPNACYELCP